MQTDDLLWQPIKQEEKEAEIDVHGSFSQTSKLVFQLNLIKIHVMI